MKTCSLLMLVWIVFGCNFRPGGDRGSESADKILQLKLKPNAGADYDYYITDNTETSFEVNDNKIESSNKTQYLVNYLINKDTAGNFDVKIKYKKIHIYTKKNGEETNIDAENAEASADPVEKMLGALKQATITAVINPSGEVISMDGYQEIANRYLSQVTADLNSKINAQNQWKQLVEKSLIKNNMGRLFKIFPDSTVHVGDKWKMDYRDEGNLNFLVKEFLTLKSIEDGKAIVESSGRISSDTSATSLMGYQVNSSLKGIQKGEYEINIKSGMLEKCKISANISGTILALGRDVPVSIDIGIKMEGTQN